MMTVLSKFKTWTFKKIIRGLKEKCFDIFVDVAIFEKLNFCSEVKINDHNPSPLRLQKHIAPFFPKNRLSIFPPNEHMHILSIFIVVSLRIFTSVTGLELLLLEISEQMTFNLNGFPKLNIRKCY